MQESGLAEITPLICTTAPEEPPGGSVVKSPPASLGDTRDTSWVPGSGRSAGGGNGNPLLYSCLENPMDRGAWQATVHGVTKESDTTERTATWDQYPVSLNPGFPRGSPWGLARV